MSRRILPLLFVPVLVACGSRGASPVVGTWASGSASFHLNDRGTGRFDQPTQPSVPLKWRLDSGRACLVQQVGGEWGKEYCGPLPTGSGRPEWTPTLPAAKGKTFRRYED